MWSLAARLAVAATACATLLVVGLPDAAAAPATDGQGYVDSKARCAPPATAVLFGSTETSRVAICTTPDGEYEYRGVRLRDGAALVAPAEDARNGFVADNDAISYLVTAKSLVISEGNKVIREEPMVDFHNPGARASTPTSTAPLPPPLPAEVGGG